MSTLPCEVGPIESSCCFQDACFPLKLRPSRWTFAGVSCRSELYAAVWVCSSAQCCMLWRFIVTWEDDCREFLSHRSISSQWNTPQEVTVGWRLSLKKGTVSFCCFVSLRHGSTPRKCEHALGTCWAGVSQLPARTQMGGWVEAPSGPSAVI